MPQNDAVRNLITEALLPKEGTAAEAEAATETEAVTPVAEGEETTTTEAPATEEAAPEAEAGTGEEAPTEYFGVNLEGLSSEDRAALIAGFSQRDKFIQQLLRNKAEDASEEATGEAAPAAEDPATDADLLKALGLDDPDDPYAEHTAKSVLPIAKLALALQEEVTSLKQFREMDTTERYWEQGLTALEAQFGKLSVSHEEVMRKAAEAGVAEPVDAYWRIAGPARQAVMAEVQTRREAVAKSLKDGAAGAQRPTNEAPASAGIIEAKNVKSAVEIAFGQIAKERGMDLNDYGDDD